MTPNPNALRRRLKATGKTQAQIARAVGVAQSTVSRFLRAQTDISVGKYGALVRFCDRQEQASARRSA